MRDNGIMIKDKDKEYKEIKLKEFTIKDNGLMTRNKDMVESIF